MTPFCLAKFEEFLGEIELIVFHAAVADGDALGLVKRVRHRAADQERVRLFHQRFDDADLVGHLRAPKDDHEGPRGFGKFSLEVFEFLLHEQPRGRFGEVSCHARRGRVGAVRRTERIVDVHVAQTRQRLRENGVVRFLLVVKTHVFEQHDLARRERIRAFFDAFADAVRAELHGRTEQFRQPFGHGFERILRHGLTLRTAEVRHEDDLGPASAQILDGRDRFRMRVSSVMDTRPSFSSVGTLKSTRTSTLRLFTLMSLTESLGMGRKQQGDRSHGKGS